MAYQVADLVNVGSLKSAIEKSKAYANNKAFVDIRFENNRLKFYTQEELDKEVTAADVEADNTKVLYAPVPAAIVDLPREQFLDELSFENSFNFATWNDNGDETFKIDAEDYASASGIVITVGEDDDPDTSNLDGKPVLILKVVTQEIDIDDSRDPKDKNAAADISETESYTFVDLSELMPFQTATNEEITEMLNEVFPELA